MLASHGRVHPLAEVRPVARLEDMQAVRAAVSEVAISAPVRRYIVDIVAGTRVPGAIRIGASPRASLALQKLAQALALMDGDTFVTPDHVREIAVPALSHRVTLDSHAQFSGTSAADAVTQALAQVPIPV